MPESKLTLARLPTPIQKLKHLSEELGKSIYLWRDDLNGMLESGNKLRKLEFLMADAIQKKCDTIITCGGPQSNHTRATAIIARQLGLDVSILVLPRPGFDRSQIPNSNLLLNQIYDTDLIWLDYDEFQKRGATYLPFLEEEENRLKQQGKKPYVIPLGGSNALGCRGYHEAIPEMLTTWEALTGTKHPSDLFCALGSGGTFVGLEWGIQEFEPSIRLHGVNVIGPIQTAEKYVQQLHHDLLQNYQIKINSAHANRIDGYVGAGYSIASDEDLRFYVELARKEGVLLDPCYTGKAFQGMISEIKKNPDRFGNEILFLHSGGTLGTFAYANQYQQILKPYSSL